MISTPHQYYLGDRSRRMRWVGHVAHVGEMRCTYIVFSGNLSERDHLKDPGIDGRVILKLVFKY